MLAMDSNRQQRALCMQWLVVWLQHTRTMMGPYIDIPGPEISAGSRMMSWLFDEYSKYKRFSPACVTGKVRHSRQAIKCVLILVEGWQLVVRDSHHTQAGNSCHEFQAVCQEFAKTGNKAFIDHARFLPHTSLLSSCWLNCFQSGPSHTHSPTLEGVL